MRKLTSPFALVLSSVIALGLTACGPSSPSSGTGDKVSADGVRTVEITGNDQMQYSVHEIKAKPGEKLRIKLTNIGRMPAQTMSHNWVLLKKMDASAVNALAMSAASKTPDHLPADQSSILAHTKLLGPGQSDTVEITVPSEAGSYPYICTFPGHAALMKGQLIVQ